jgi:colanic acid/amylovoran biosynthesis glycosyltransferase
MKIAVILNGFPEISEKFLLNQIVGMIAAGADITVFAAHRPSTDKRHDIWNEYKVESYTRYLDIPRNPKKRILAFPLLFLKVLFKCPKAAFEAFKFNTYQTAVKNGKALYFANAFAGEFFDIVHCHFGPNGLIGVYLKESGLCKAVVTAFHGSDINSYPKRYGTSVYRSLYDKSDIITSNTNFTKAKIVANGCPAEKIVIIPECLIVSEYTLPSPPERRENVLLTVGRLEEKKGHRYVLQALVKIRERIPSVRYIIAGDGGLAESLKSLARDLGLWDICEFRGLCTSSQVRELYLSSTVFTLPSVTASNGDMEGQGLVLQEAQMCGLPVVTTWHNGIPDGLIDGQTGYLVEERDVDALADRIISLFQEPQKRESMGESGKGFVAATYDISIITKNLLSHFAHLFPSQM